MEIFASKKNTISDQEYIICNILHDNVWLKVIVSNNKLVINKKKEDLLINRLNWDIIDYSILESFLRKLLDIDFRAYIYEQQCNNRDKNKY